MDKASILVIGGCGFQGSSIIEKLLARYPQAKIAAMGRNPTENRFPGVQYLKGDITNPEDVRRVFEAFPPTVVFHTAAAMQSPRLLTADNVVWKVNEGGTKNVLEAAKRAGVKALVNTSSASVIQKEGYKDIVNGDETWPMVTPEDKMQAYATSKASAERLVRSFDDPAGMRTCTLRPAGLYGERDNDQIPGMMKVMRSGRHKMQIGDNKNLFDMTYIGNSSDAHILAAEKLLSRDDAVANAVGGESFFITNGYPTPFWDHGRAIYRAAGDTTQPKDVRVMSRTFMLVLAYVSEWVAWARGTKPLISATSVKYATMTRYYNIQKARDRLGYEPKVSWEEGIQRGVKWYLEHEKEEQNGGSGKGT